ncbi:MAG: hypothetical protein EA369_05875 [Bradymonadales bacterium]|nr:MAG: hypothetical protein EA369_05875 [Bradymonadales bacterium]
MTRAALVLLLLVTSLLLNQSLEARPVGAKGSFSIMSQSSPEMNELHAHFAASRHFSLGAQFLRLDTKAPRLYAGLAQANLLIHRWNHPSFQANIYAMGGLGQGRSDGRYALVGMAGAQADMEDQRFYGMLAYNSYLSRLIPNFHSYTARAGFAPYIGEFHEFHSWVILQYVFKPGFQERHSVTPLFRFFYRNMLAEIGVSLTGSFQFNFVTEF